MRGRLDRELAAMGVGPLSNQERTDYARRAASVLAHIARQPGSPFEPDLPAAGPSVSIALANPDPSIAADAAIVLGDIPNVDAQETLGKVAIDESKPAPLRLMATRQLAQNLRRFGSKLAGEQKKQLTDELAQTTDAPFREALATVVGLLKSER
jgi:hypothetical protein